MNEPSDPQRPKGGDRPRETAAFEDTEFSFGKAASTPPTSRQGYLADVVESDHPDVPDDGTVIDAEIVDETGPAGDHGRSTASRPPVLGSTTDPEMTGIIPAVRDDSERPGTGPGTAGSAAAGSAAAEETAVGAVPPVAASPSGQTSPEGVPAGGSGDDGGDGRSFSFRSVPPWAWILVIGVVLAVLVGLFAASLMRHNSVSDSSPLTSVVPSYGRPTAWNSTTPTTTKIPDNSAGLGYDGYGYGYGDQSGDDSWNDGSDWTDTTEEPDTSGPTGTPSTGAPGTGQETPGGTGTPGTGGGTTPGTPGTDPGTGTSPGTDPGTGGTPGTGETPGTGGGTTPGTGDGDSTTTE